MIKFECEEEIKSERVTISTTSNGNQVITGRGHAILLQDGYYIVKTEYYVPENIVKESATPTFGEVEESQFFIDNRGRLCQKVFEVSYNVLADYRGNPNCLTGLYDLDYNSPVRKILPKVTKITWE